MQLIGNDSQKVIDVIRVTKKDEVYIKLDYIKNQNTSFKSYIPANFGVSILHPINKGILNYLFH